MSTRTYAMTRRGAASRNRRVSVPFPVVFLFCGIPVVIAAAFTTGSEDHDQTGSSSTATEGHGPVATVLEAPKPVFLKFSPPFHLSEAQWDYHEMAKQIVCNPASWGLDKPSVFCDRNLLEFYTGSVLWSENKLSHYDLDGNVAWSYTGCCLGGTQVYTETSVCTLEEIKDPRTNIWCGATIFKGYYDTYGLKAGDRALEITVATYKNAVVMNEDKTAMVLDENGLPIIPPDDPSNPYDFWSQVQSAFIYDGMPMFEFVSE